MEELEYYDLRIRLDQEGEGYALKSYYGRNIKHKDKEVVRLWAEAHDKLLELENYIDKKIKENYEQHFNMKVQYRIANINGDYFPQVKTKKFLFWSSWKRIAEHPTGYGMYGQQDRDYPKTKKECEQIIFDFDKWFKKKNIVNEKYINLKLEVNEKNQLG